MSQVSTAREVELLAMLSAANAKIADISTDLSAANTKIADLSTELSAANTALSAANARNVVLVNEIGSCSYCLGFYACTEFCCIG